MEDRCDNLILRNLFHEDVVSVQTVGERRAHTMAFAYLFCKILADISHTAHRTSHEGSLRISLCPVATDQPLSELSITMQQGMQMKAAPSGPAFSGNQIPNTFSAILAKPFHKFLKSNRPDMWCHLFILRLGAASGPQERPPKGPFAQKDGRGIRGETPLASFVADKISVGLNENAKSCGLG